MKLYEISQQYTNFIDAVECGEIPQEAIEDTLASIQGDFSDKADNIACLIKNYQAQVKAIKEEREKLSEREKSAKAQADWWKKYLLQEMQFTKNKKITTARNVISLRKSKVVVADDNFINWAKGNDASLLSFKEPTANKTAVKELLKVGNKVPHCKLVEKQNITIK